jgi:hypothetical protein
LFLLGNGFTPIETTLVTYSKEKRPEICRLLRQLLYLSIILLADPNDGKHFNVACCVSTDPISKYFYKQKFRFVIHNLTRLQGKLQKFTSKLDHACLFSLACDNTRSPGQTSMKSDRNYAQISRHIEIWLKYRNRNNPEQASVALTLNTCIMTCVDGNLAETWLFSLSLSCVEAGSNTSTVALRVVGGDEKGTQCLGV